MRSPRFEVLRCLHAIDATRLHQTRSWLVSLSNLRPFGPRRATATRRAGLDERLAEVRVRYKSQPYNKLLVGPQAKNELVCRIQPDEVPSGVLASRPSTKKRPPCIIAPGDDRLETPRDTHERPQHAKPPQALYLKTHTKRPGLEQDVEPTCMDMRYASTFGGSYLADAYERMFLNAAKGDSSLFVSSGELREAWRVFTPLLHAIDKVRPKPILYAFGERNPRGFRDWS